MQAQIRATDGLVLQVGEGLGPREGCLIVDLDEEETSALSTALDLPNGGVLLDKGGDWQAKPVPDPPAPTPNPYAILRSLLEFSEGPEDLIDILDMQFQILGG